MVWQDIPPLPGARLDPDEEQELRLVAQARLGADWALEALIARYQPPVTRYLVRLTGDAEGIAALAERVFLRMERRVRGPQGGEHLRLWLLRACTEIGLDTLRRPHSARPQQLGTSQPAALLTARTGVAAQRLRAGLGKLAEVTGTTSRQVRQLIWSEPTDGSEPRPRERHQPADTRAADASPMGGAAAEDALDPRDALRHRLVRAVLAELPYGDAQCLALHLVAGLNQAEVASALGIRASAARRHIVQGLQVFGHRYETALTTMGVPIEFAYSNGSEEAEDVGQPGPVVLPQAPTERLPIRPAERPAVAAAQRDDVVQRPARVPLAADTVVTSAESRPLPAPVWQAPPSEGTADSPLSSLAAQASGQSMMTTLLGHTAATVPLPPPQAEEELTLAALAGIVFGATDRSVAEGADQFAETPGAVDVVDATTLGRVVDAAPLPLLPPPYSLPSAEPAVWDFTETTDAAEATATLLAHAYVESSVEVEQAEIALPVAPDVVAPDVVAPDVAVAVVPVLSQASVANEAVAAVGVHQAPPVQAPLAPMVVPVVTARADDALPLAPTAADVPVRRVPIVTGVPVLTPTN